MNRSTLFLGAAVVLAACADDPTSPNGDPPVSGPIPSARTHLVAAQQGRTARGFEDEILRLENRVPGMGGMFRDSDGNIVVYLQDVTQRGAAMRELQSAAGTLKADRTFRAQLQAGRNVSFRKGEHTFSQLVEWQSAVLRSVARLPGLTAVDADESLNRVRVTLADGTPRADVDAAIAALNLPPGAVAVDFGPRLEFLDIRARYRPTGGGIQISNAENELCTMGFNVAVLFYFESGYLTASHCNEGGIGVGNTGGTIYQNTIGASNQAGTVTLNPAWNRTDPECGGMTCTWADVMFVRTTASLFEKRVAHPTFVGVNSAPGSTTLASWWTRVEKAWFLPYVGLSVDKVGRTTGWTRGTVASTCSANVVAGLVILCSDLVTGARSDYGDSGSPVFYPEVAPDPLYALGILYAGIVNCTDNCAFSFTSWSAIESHLSRYFDYTPRFGSVDISGPLDIRANEECTWSASSSLEQPQYEWSVNGVIEGFGPTFRRSFLHGRYGLSVRVWNYHGAEASDAVLVKVSNFNPSVC